jgi:hypothetical protein
LFVVNFIGLGQGSYQLHHALGKKQDGFVGELVVPKEAETSGFVQIFNLDKSILELVNLYDKRGHFE